jgi:hypothetical protein
MNDVIRYGYQIIVKPRDWKSKFDHDWWKAQVNSLVCSAAMKEGHELAGKPICSITKVVWVPDDLGRKTEGRYVDTVTARELGYEWNPSSEAFAFRSTVLCHQKEVHHGPIG